MVFRQYMPCDPVDTVMLNDSASGPMTMPPEVSMTTLGLVCSAPEIPKQPKEKYAFRMLGR